MKKIFFVVLLTGIITATQVKAQESLFSVQYSMGFAAGDLKEFNEAASFRGMSFEYRYMMQPAIGVGLETGYNLFYDRMDYATYTQGTQSVSGVQYRYTHAVPVLAAFDYYLKPDTQFNPFVGLGVGTLYTFRDLDMGMLTMESDAWQFALRPEVGCIISTQAADVLIGAKYFSGFKANDTEGQSYFTINVGLVF
ncbi:MAG TPA: outer membrane beta-barrel protein [Draconibacterium sp.]|nr:outer membrane beta-barrel protein [Draconibacterium sp.]